MVKLLRCLTRRGGSCSLVLAQGKAHVFAIMCTKCSVGKGVHIRRYSWPQYASRQNFPAKSDADFQCCCCNFTMVALVFAQGVVREALVLAQCVVSHVDTCVHARRC